MPLTVDTVIAGGEQVVLDPSEVATGRVEVDITGLVNRDGVDWGDAAVEQHMAEAERGQVPVDSRTPNRTVTIPLLIQDRDLDVFEGLRQDIQAKCALFQQDGGWIKRQTAIGPVYADVVSATLKLGGSSAQALWGIDADAVLTLECTPDWYADEAELNLTVLSTTGGYVALIDPVDGNYPARVEIRVTDVSGNDQRGLICALRCRNYDADATAAPIYRADALTPLDAAAVATVAGRSVVRHQSLTADWTPVVGTALGGADLRHVGSYRLWVVGYSSSPSPPKLRAVADVGDLTFPAENAAVQIPDSSGWYLLDLGELRLDRIPGGTHRWRGQIQAKGPAGGENVSIYQLFLADFDEMYLKAQAPATQVQGLAAFSAHDEFNQSAGALAGQMLPLGGTWSGAGDSDDFAVTGSGQATRTASLDTLNTGRYAVAGTASFTDVAVSVKAWQFGYTMGSSTTLRQGVLARYADVNNWLHATVEQQETGTGPIFYFVRVVKKIGGTRTVIKNLSLPSNLKGEVPRYIKLQALASGDYAVWVGPSADALGDPVATGTDSALATGGALETGKTGIYDEMGGGITPNRYYDNFQVVVPPRGDAVIFANQKAQLRTDGIVRDDPTGVAPGPVSFALDTLPRLPVGGLEGRPCELLVIPSRGDLNQLPHPGLDQLSVRVFARTCWAYVPDS